MTTVECFVVGIHGVGKSSLCKKIAEHYSYTHVIASDLIKNVKYQQSKQVSKPDENQKVLIEELRKLSGNIILDGHICLLTKEDKMVPIKYEFIELINPSSIICLFDNPENIYQRLLERDGKNYPLELIKSLQELELKTSKDYAHALGVPCKALSLSENSAEVDFESILTRI